MLWPGTELAPWLSCMGVILAFTTTGIQNIGSIQWTDTSTLVWEVKGIWWIDDAWVWFINIMPADALSAWPPGHQQAWYWPIRLHHPRDDIVTLRGDKDLPTHMHRYTVPPNVCRTTLTIMTRDTEGAAPAKIKQNKTRAQICYQRTENTSIELIN